MANAIHAKINRADRAARSFVFDMLIATIVLGSVASAVAAVVLPINQLTQPGGQTSVSLTPEAQEQALDGIQGIPAGSWLELTQNGYPVELHVSALSWPLRLLTEAGSSVLFACLAVMGLLLYRTLRSIRAGTPFDPANPRRLRLIGFLAILGGLGGQILEAMARFALLETTGLAEAGSPIEIAATLDITWLWTGAIALAFAEAFAHGKRLTDDVEGLV